MKRVTAIVLAVVMLATMGGVVMAATVDPAELNLVLVAPGPAGAASVEKTVSGVEEGHEVTATVAIDEEIAIQFAPGGVNSADPITVDGSGNATWMEQIGISPTASGSGPWYATVTFYDDGSECGTQRISVTLGDLDIKPGSYPNSINTKKGGVTPVAILGTEDLAVEDIDVETIVFYAAAGTEVAPAHNLTDPDVFADHLQDVNFDGNLDLVCHFKTKDADWTGYTVGGVGQYATVYFEENDTTAHTLTDSVNIVKV